MPEKRVNFILSLATLLLISILFTGSGYSDYGELFSFEYQDPAGDVLLYNMTNNGTTTEKSGLDIKWVRSSEDGKGNVVIKVDLKARDKFIIDNSTKYVVRVFTTPDNSTGFNITYTNLTAELVFFNATGEMMKYDVISNVSINDERDDEIMEIEVNITKFLSNISHFNIDAYSMMITSNATYLDFISQLPGHPEFVNPEVENVEGLDTDGNGVSDDGPNSFLIILFVLLLLGLLLIVGFITIFLIIFVRKRKGKGE